VVDGHGSGILDLEVNGGKVGLSTARHDTSGSGLGQPPDWCLVALLVVPCS